LLNRRVDPEVAGAAIASEVAATHEIAAPAITARWTYKSRETKSGTGLEVWNMRIGEKSPQGRKGDSIVYLANFPPIMMRAF
jgi:hypothetical protein